MKLSALHQSQISQLVMNYSVVISGISTESLHHLLVHVNELSHLSVLTEPGMNMMVSMLNVIVVHVLNDTSQTQPTCIDQDV